MNDPTLWNNLAALAALCGVIAYALSAGADFGGGVWDLFAAGPRKREQRLAIQHAMGPVWEANHVWLILVVVILFTCFPKGYSAIGIAMFLPFHLALLGIMLRGASFVFRSYQSRQKEAVANTSAWGVVFGAASIIAPLLLGASFGMLTEGGIRLDDLNQVSVAAPLAWLSPYCLANALLALSTCAYLAAVYLTTETDGELREDFRRRAIAAGTTTAALALLVLLLAWNSAHWFVERLLSARTLPVIVAGLLCFAGSAWSVFARRFRLSQIFAASEIALVLVGWGLAQHPYFVYPDIPFSRVAAPLPTVRFVVLSLIPAAIIIGPSLVLLFIVFKKRTSEQQQP